MTPLARRNRVRAVFLASLLVVLGGGLWFAVGASYRYGVEGPVSNSIDFRAFYCGAKTLRIGADPYRLEPMRSCQREALAAAGLAGNGRTMPAPLPPYALATLAFLSLLPIRAATQLWLTLSVVSLGLSIVVLTRLTELRPAAVAAALVVSVGFASLVLGQLVPVVFCAVVLGAWYARGKNGCAAAVCATVAAIEPHVALALWAGLLAAVPAARRPLVLAGVGLACLTLAFGWPLTHEYFTTALPQHARSELYNFSAQYSAASLVALSGLAPALCVAIGSASYAVMLATGTLVGSRLSRRYNDPAFAVFTPVAAILFGGQFLHITQIALALPLALLCYARLSPRAPATYVTLAAIVALAIPWETVAESPAYWDHHPMSHAIAPLPVPSVSHGDDSIELQYTQAIDAYGERLDPRSLPEQVLWKLPTWLGLMIILCIATRLMRRYLVPRSRCRAIRAYSSEREP